MADMFDRWWQVAKDFFYSLILSLQTILKDICIWFFDAVMGLAVMLLGGMGDIFSSLNVAQYINAIPGDVASVLSLIGLSEATGMIIIAITIRLMLQLIPFTRLGS